MTETERMYAYLYAVFHDRRGKSRSAAKQIRGPAGVYEAGTAGWREILSDSVVEYMDRQKKAVILKKNITA